MADRRATRPSGWMVLTFVLAAFQCALTWVLAHQASPPVIEACAAPAFDRNPPKGATR